MGWGWMVVVGSTQLKPWDDDDDDDDDDDVPHKKTEKGKTKNNWHAGWWAYPYIIHSNVLMLGSFCIGSLVSQKIALGSQISNMLSAKETKPRMIS